MKTVKQFQKTTLKALTKAIFAASVLTFGILPTHSQDMIAFNSGGNVESPAIKKQNLLKIENGVETSGEKIELNYLQFQELSNEIEYHPQQFVDAEIASEMQMMENANQIESAELEDFIKISPYNAAQFVEAEMQSELATRLQNY